MENMGCVGEARREQAPPFSVGDERYYVSRVMSDTKSDMRTPTSAKRAGQVTIEYFIIFAVLALVTVIGLGTTFHKNVQQSLEDFFTKAADTVATPNADGGASGVNPGNGGDGGDGGDRGGRGGKEQF